MMPSLASYLCRSLFALATILFLTSPLAIAEEFELEPELESEPASIETSGEQSNYDPYEKLNRKVFAFNHFLDTWFLRPVAKAYRWVTPTFVDNSITRVFANLGEINNLLNSTLQGDLRQAGTSTGRFLVNSTIGVAGIFDVASEFGWEERKEDFGQTLAVWGVGPGPHVVLPFWGSRTLRDSFSMIPDVYASPVTYINEVSVRNSVRGLDEVDTRGDLISVESLIIGDRYTFLRDVYMQLRESDIANGEQKDSADDFSDEFDDEFEDDF